MSLLSDTLSDFRNKPDSNYLRKKWLISRLVSHKLRGGALYVSILVSVVIGIILSLFILISKYDQGMITKLDRTAQLHLNLQSAFQIAQSTFFSEATNNMWIKITNCDDSIRVHKIYWGAYVVISTESKNTHSYISKAGIYGTHIPADTGLLVSENSRPVGASGTIVFKSHCFLPKAGIKPANIGSQTYFADPQNKNFIKRSPFMIPNIHDDLRRQLEKTQNQLLDGDSIADFIPSELRQSFRNRTITWLPGSDTLRSVDLSDNIKIISRQLYIDSSSHLDNVLIVCDKVRFKKGFKGRIHVIARDSITMESGCEFRFPSSLVLLSNGQGGVRFNENCSLSGAVLAFNPTSSFNQKISIHLNKKSEINGLLYSAGLLHLEGTLNATAISHRLQIRTSSAVYENHMMACQIDPHKKAHVILVPQIFEDRGNLQLCENLN